MKNLITRSLIAFSCALGNAQLQPGYEKIRLKNAVYPYTLIENVDTLKVHGMGIKKTLAKDLYSGGLYTKIKMTSSKEIINSPEDMGIRLIILSKKMNKKDVTAMIKKGFKESTDNKVGQFNQEIAQLMALFQGDVYINDTFDFFYNRASKSMNVYKNNILFDTIKGYKFKKALFDIWLGKKPVCKYIKRGMLNEEQI